MSWTAFFQTVGLVTYLSIWVIIIIFALGDQFGKGSK